MGSSVMYLTYAQVREGEREEKSTERKGAGEKGRSTAGQRWRPGTEAVPPQSEAAPPSA
jgi:hypothetical protein